MSRSLLPIALGLLLLSATPSRADAADAVALGKTLKDPDLDAAFAASEKLLALGADAKPALPALIEALGRTLPQGVAQKHWDPWMAVLPEFHANVIRTIDRIAPKDAAALPALIPHLDRTPEEIRSLVVGMLLTLWPHEPKSREALLSLAASGAKRLDASTHARVRLWLTAEGIEGIRGLDGMLGNGDSDDRAFAAETLRGLGAPGLEVLVEHFRAEGWNGKSELLRMWVRVGKLPPETMPTAITQLALEGDEALARAVDASATDRDAVVAALATALDKTKFHFDGWRHLCKATPELSRRVGARWFLAHRPTPAAQPFDAAGLRRTALLGGPGGDPFEIAIERGTLVGLRYTYGTWNWKPVIRSLQPLFETADGPVEGRVVGEKGPKSGEVKAIDGYALAGLYAQATDRFEAFAVLFMRMRKKGSGLDPADAYVDTWHGGAIVGREERPIGCEGRRIVGIVGRSGADIDALGLVEAKGEAEAAPQK